MYGGDEVAAIVVDVGSSTTKAGYAGEDTPKCVFPSVVGYFPGKMKANGKANKEPSEAEGKNYVVGTNALSVRRDFMEIGYPLQKGLVHDWDQWEALMDHALIDRLGINTKEHPILMTEPSFNTRPLREKLTEIMFEKYEIPVLFVSKNGVLTSFASGKASGLILDSGGGVTCATPVHDGYALQKATLHQTLAGDRLTEEFLKTLEQGGVKIHPHYMIKSKKEIRLNEFEVELRDVANTTASYTTYMNKEVVRDIKETVCRVSDVAWNEDKANANIPGVPYELPDGHTIELGTDRFAIPELMFNPEPLNKRENEKFIGIPTMIYNSIAQCDADIRRELFSNIIVTGGNTLLPQFPDRLHKELMELSPPQMYKVKIVATNSSIERKYSSWIGGSILASLGTFQQMWMSKQEYEENGRTLVERKCP